MQSLGAAVGDSLGAVVSDALGAAVGDALGAVVGNALGAVVWDAFGAAAGVSPSVCVACAGGMDADFEPLGPTSTSKTSRMTTARLPLLSLGQRTCGGLLHSAEGLALFRAWWADRLFALPTYWTH